MVREVRSSDIEQVSAITEASGWGPTTLSGWQHLWVDNPSVRDGSPAVPKGWVLEEAGRVVGYLCNLTGRYRLGPRTLRVAAAGSLVVLPEHRGLSLQLLLEFAKQKNVDLLLNTTAAPHVTKICEFLKFTRIPQPDYDLSLYWVLGSRRFVGAALRKKGAPPALARLGAVALAAPVALYVAHRHRFKYSTAGVDVSVMEPLAIDDSFDSLWERVCVSDRLLAFRDSATLRWHLAPSRHEGWPFLVTAHDGQRLRGYAAFVRQDAPHLGLIRARVADLIVEDDDRQIVQALLMTGLTEARHRGAAMVELIGFPESIRRAASDLKPFGLKSEAWPFLYRANDDDLRRSLARKELWYASLFDGDGSL